MALKYGADEQQHGSKRAVMLCVCVCLVAGKTVLVCYRVDVFTL